MQHKRNIMIRNPYITILFSAALLVVAGCQSGKKESDSGNMNEVKLITLDPAHFHAALVQKTMYPGIDSVVHVYAPEGLGLTEQLNYIKQYNNRTETPTHWVEQSYTGNDYFAKMLEEKKGNVVVLAGNNMRKTEYIKRSVDNGFNVLADKPMAISVANFDSLQQAFTDAKQKGVLLYDIMTERSVMATILQKRLAHTKNVFGELKKGTADSPAVIMESVHRYFKQVSGKPLIRPDWFFDPQQEGDAIVDVGTHLVDLVQWICFPEEAIDYKTDVDIHSARIWPTPLALSQFTNITKEDHFPDFLKQYVKNDSILLTHGNGEANYTLKGIHTQVTVKWTYDAPAGAGDTYNSLLSGTKAQLEIRQGEEEAWQPVLYVWPTKETKNIKAFAENLQQAIEDINKDYPGVSMQEYKNASATGWKIIIPQKYLLGHEAHFADVMKRYLQYLKEGKLPDWEVAGMIAKYYTTTKALEIAEKQ